MSLEAIGVVIALLGALATVGGGFFWLGKLQSQVTTLSQECKEMKTKLEKVETEQTEQKLAIAKVVQGVEHLKDGQKVLFEKLDLMTESFVRHKFDEDKTV